MLLRRPLESDHGRYKQHALQHPALCEQPEAGGAFAGVYRKANHQVEDKEASAEVGEAQQLALITDADDSSEFRETQLHHARQAGVLLAKT